MVVLVGQVARHQIDREAFQEVDFRRMFAPLAKWVAQIDMAERVPELVNQAFQVATSGRPGPVVLALPEDMLRDRRAAPVSGPYRPGARPSRRGRSRRVAAAARGGAAADDAGRRQRLERRGLPRHHPLCGGERSAGLLLVPASGYRRQPLAMLCRRSRHRGEPDAGRAGQGIRPVAGGRRAHRRDHLAILFA